MGITLLLSVSIFALLMAYCFYTKQDRVWYLFPISLIIINGFNSSNADWINYENMFNKIAVSSSVQDAFTLHGDKGYIFLELLATALGIDYCVFRVVLISLMTLILFWYVRKTGVPVALFFVMYLLYPFFIDTIQVRNFMLETMLFIAFYYLVREHDIHGKLIYVTIMLVASTYQGMGLLYLWFIPFLFFYQNKMFRKLLYVLIALGLLYPLYATTIYSLSSDIYVWATSTDFSVAKRLVSYVGKYSGNIMERRIWAFMLVTTAALYCMHRYVKDGNIQIFSKRYLEYLFKLSLFLCCLIPLYGVDLNFASRLSRNMLPIFYAGGLLYAESLSSRRKIFGMTFFVMFLGFYYGCSDLYVPHARGEVMRILENNWLFDILDF